MKDVNSVQLLDKIISLSEQLVNSVFTKRKYNRDWEGVSPREFLDFKVSFRGGESDSSPVVIFVTLFGANGFSASYKIDSGCVFMREGYIRIASTHLDILNHLLGVYLELSADFVLMDYIRSVGERAIIESVGDALGGTSHRQWVYDDLRAYLNNGGEKSYYSESIWERVSETFSAELVPYIEEYLLVLFSLTDDSEFILDIVMNMGSDLKVWNRETFQREFVASWQPRFSSLLSGRIDTDSGLYRSKDGLLVLRQENISLDFD